MRDALLSAQPVLLTSWRDSKPQQGQKISAEGEKVRELEGEMGCVRGGKSKSKAGRIGTSPLSPLTKCTLVAPGTPRYSTIILLIVQIDKSKNFIGTMSKKQGNTMDLIFFFVRGTMMKHLQLISHP